MAGFIPDAVRQDWCTPQFIIDAARAAFRDDIHLDPCSNAESLVKAKTEYILPVNDGLKDSWDFHTIYVNPPFGTSHMKRDGSGFATPQEWRAMTAEQRLGYVTTDITDWIERASLSSRLHGSQVIMLLPLTPETAAWKSYVLRTSAGICMLGKRVKFVGAPTSIPKAMAVAYWRGVGSHYEQFESVFKYLGSCIRTDHITAHFKEQMIA